MQETSVLDLELARCAACSYLFITFSFKGGRRSKQVEEEGRDRKKGNRTKKKERSAKKGPAGKPGTGIDTS